MYSTSSNKENASINKYVEISKTIYIYLKNATVFGLILFTNNASGFVVIFYQYCNDFPFRSELKSKHEQL